MAQIVASSISVIYPIDTYITPSYYSSLNVLSYSCYIQPCTIPQKGMVARYTPEVDGTMPFAYYIKIPIYPILYLLKGDYTPSRILPKIVWEPCIPLDPKP